MENKKAIITAEEEQKLLRPIDEYIGKIQEKINALRENGTDRIISLNNHIAVTRENANYTKEEKAAIVAEDKKALVTAKAVEQQNKEEVRKLIGEAEKYLDEHYDSEYYSKVVASCREQTAAETARYEKEISGDAAEGFIITNSHTPKPPVVPPPRTGDESHLVRYTMLMSLSFAGIVFVLTKKRKEERA